MKATKAVFILTLALLAAPGAMAETGEEIMQRVLDNQRVDSSAMDIEMTLLSPNGTESRRRIQTLILDTDELSGTITVFLEPASIRNTRFLTLENDGRSDDQWIYLPSLRKVRRIAATDQDGSFMGSDFSYSDMSFARNSVDDSDHTWLKDEMLSGRSCAVVESVPKPANGASYSKQISWVDRETWLPLRVEFYRSNAPVKVMEAGNLKQIDGRWLTGTITMTTTESGHRTVLDFKQVRYGIPLDPGYFTPAFLETGRKP